MELTVTQELERGIAAHKAGNLKEAERLYRAILQSQPLHPDANHNLGVLAVSVNKVDVSLPLFKTALEANPKIEQFWLSYIDALIKDNKHEVAVQVLEDARKHGVTSEKLQVLEGQLISVVQSINSTSPSKQQLVVLLDYYQKQQFVEAEKLGLFLTKAFPSHPFSWKVLGALFGQTERHTEALNANQKAVELSPGDAEAHSNLGNTLKELGRLDEAEEKYKQSIIFQPEYAKAHYNLGIALEDVGRLNEAKASYATAIKLKSNFTVAHYNFGVTLQKLGRLEEAEASYKHAIELNPGFVEAHSNLGATLQALGRSEEAETSYKQVIKLKPDYAEGRYNLGATLQALGRSEEAEGSYKHAIELKPDFAEAHGNLGVTLHELGRFEEAKASFSTHGAQNEAWLGSDIIGKVVNSLAATIA